MIKKTKFKDLILINNKSFKDRRGYFKELLLEKNLKKKFPFLVMSFSKKNVIRGLHLQTRNSQGKFISVIKGKNNGINKGKSQYFLFIKTCGSTEP